MDFEKLGVSSISVSRYDAQSAPALPRNPVLYDSSDLLTHAVCIGMTGSGKTGLGIALDGGSRHRRRAGARDRSEGRSLQSDAHVSWPDGGGVRAVGESRRSARAATDAGRVRRRTKRSAGRRAWPSGDRTAAHRAPEGGRRRGRLHAGQPRRHCRCRFSRPSTRHPRPSRDEPELLAARVQSAATSVLSLAGVTPIRRPAASTSWCRRCCRRPGGLDESSISPRSSPRCSRRR